MILSPYYSLYFTLYFDWRRMFRRPVPAAPAQRDTAAITNNAGTQAFWRKAGRDAAAAAAAAKQSLFSPEGVLQALHLSPQPRFFLRSFSAVGVELCSSIMMSKRVQESDGEHDHRHHPEQACAAAASPLLPIGGAAVVAAPAPAPAPATFPRCFLAERASSRRRRSGAWGRAVVRPLVPLNAAAAAAAAPPAYIVRRGARREWHGCAWVHLAHQLLLRPLVTPLAPVCLLFAEKHRQSLRRRTRCVFRSALSQVEDLPSSRCSACPINVVSQAQNSLGECEKDVSSTTSVMGNESWA